MAETVQIRGQRIYNYLRSHLNRPFRKEDLFRHLDLNSSGTTRRAIQRARELAEADGLYLTVPVAANGYTMGVTDDPSAAIDPALWLAKCEEGVRVPREIAEDFVRSRFEAMSAQDRAMTKAVIALRDAMESQEQQRKQLNEVTDALIEARRELRAGQSNGSAEA